MTSRRTAAVLCRTATRALIASTALLAAGCDGGISGLDFFLPDEAQTVITYEVGAARPTLEPWVHEAARLRSAERVLHPTASTDPNQPRRNLVVQYLAASPETLQLPLGPVARADGRCQTRSILKSTLDPDPVIASRILTLDGFGPIEFDPRSPAGALESANENRLGELRDFRWNTPCECPVLAAFDLLDETYSADEVLVHRVDAQRLAVFANPRGLLVDAEATAKAGRLVAQPFIVDLPACDTSTQTIRAFAASHDSFLFAGQLGCISRAPLPSFPTEPLQSGAPPQRLAAEHVARIAVSPLCAIRGDQACRPTERLSVSPGTPQTTIVSSGDGRVHTLGADGRLTMLVDEATELVTEAGGLVFWVAEDEAWIVRFARLEVLRYRPALGTLSEVAIPVPMEGYLHITRGPGGDGTLILPQLQGMIHIGEGGALGRWLYDIEGGLTVIAENWNDDIVIGTGKGTFEVVTPHGFICPAPALPTTVWALDIAATNDAGIILGSHNSADPDRDREPSPTALLLVALPD